MSSQTAAASSAGTVAPIPYKFGSHYTNCNCTACLGILAGLRKRPYVQALEEQIAADKDTLRLMQNTIQQSVQGSQARERHVTALETKLNKAEGTLLSVRGQLEVISRESARLIEEQDNLRADLANAKAEGASWCEEYNQCHTTLNRTQEALNRTQEALAYAAWDLSETLAEREEMVLRQQRAAAMSRFHFTLAGIVTFLIGSGAMFFVGRYAK